MPSAEKNIKIKASADHNGHLAKILRTTRVISADDSGKLPTEIEVLRTGMWETPWHGNFMVTPDDLTQYVSNFNNDIRPNSSTQGLPIDLDHDQGAAAGWMKKLYVQSNEDGGMSLWASVAWTPLGVQKLTDREFTMFSPEFCPEEYYDPEGEDEPCDNVLIGGGLTNRPLFKDLTPIMASENADDKTATKGEFKKLYLSASAKENTVPTLEETRKKDVASLNDEEKRLLADNKDQLNAEEQAKFGLAEAPANNDGGEEEAPAGDEADEPAETPAAAAPVAASEKGQVVMAKEEVEKLQADAKLGVLAHAQLQKSKVTEHINSSCFNERTGFKFKADMREELVGLYLNANDAQQKTLDKLFEAAQPIKSADEMGAMGSGQDSNASNAYAGLVVKANEIIKASDGGKMPFADAMLQARQELPEMAATYDELENNRPLATARA